MTETEAEKEAAKTAYHQQNRLERGIPLDRPANPYQVYKVPPPTAEERIEALEAALRQFHREPEGRDDDNAELRLQVAVRDHKIEAQSAAIKGLQKLVGNALGQQYEDLSVQDHL